MHLVLEGRLLSGLQATYGSFMFQGIILSGDASGVTTAAISHTDGAGLHHPCESHISVYLDWSKDLVCC